MHGLILNEAFDLINAKQRDELERIAAMWGAYLNRPISGREAACMLALLTLAREVPDFPAHRKIDGLTEAAGYLGLAGEFAVREAAARAEAAAEAEPCELDKISPWRVF